MSIPIFGSQHTLPHPFLLRMSKPSLSSLHTQITELQQRRADNSALIVALTARLDALTAPAPVAEKKKRAKNPDTPKKTRAPSSWIVFLGKKREEAKTAHPDAKMTELTTIISKMWAVLTPEQKAEYKPAAPAAPAAAPAAARAAKPTFQEVHDVALTMSSTVAGKFLRFCVQNHTLDAKTAEASWKSLSPEEKAKFNDPGDDTDDYDSSDDEE